MNKTEELKINYESKIIQVVSLDNSRGNTIHFLWNTTKHLEYTVLEIITHNPRNSQNFLLKRMNGISQEDCLVKMFAYLKKEYKEEHNWTVFWIDEDGNEHQSYFVGTDEDEVKTKFFYDENTTAKIERIKKSPIA